MAQDLRGLMRNDITRDDGTMPDGHEARFLNKLDAALPTQATKPKSNWLGIAASVIVLIGLTLGAFKFFNTPKPIDNPTETVTITERKTLGDVSPDLKKVEDYYLANINLQLSKVQLTPDNKELFDSYVNRLEVLNAEYLKLSDDLTANGPSEPTVNALINNLKLRLNLLYRLQEQLEDFKGSENTSGTI